MVEPRAAPVEKVERWPINRLLPYAGNPKTHPPEQIDLIAKSMERFGQAQIVLIDEAGEIIAGHGRVLAAQKLGWDSLVVGEARGWSEEEKKAYRVADNQLGMIAPFDMSKLKLEMQELSLAKFDMGVLGFAAPQLFELLAAEPAPDAKAEEAPPLPKKPVVRAGDLWTLGHHRILCGDATLADDVAKLLGQDKPHLMVTDPPYGVNHDPHWREEAGVSSFGPQARGLVRNDNRIDWHEAWRLFSGDVAYVWHADRHASLVQASLEVAGLKIRSQIIWVKPTFIFGRGNYHWQHEPCWYAVREKGIGHWTGDRKQSTVWQINSLHVMSASRGDADNPITGHSTQKPVECMKRPVENNSRAGDAVYDPFAGTGTTIIASEIAARRCMAMDIDPGYVQVAIERWQTFTSKEATLDGKSFEAVKAERLRSGGRSRKVDRSGVSDHPAAGGKRRPRLDAKRKGGSTSAAPT